MEVKPNSFKSTYAVDEYLDLAGAFIDVVYSSGDTERVSITSDMVVGFDTATTGNKTLMVTYKTLSQAITYSVYNPEMASRPIRTTARFTLYADVIEDDIVYTIKVALGDLTELRAATFTLTSTTSLGIESEHTLTCRYNRWRSLFL